jgi:ribosome-associated translation inhibitor RaiA
LRRPFATFGGTSVFATVLNQTSVETTSAIRFILGESMENLITTVEPSLMGPESGPPIAALAPAPALAARVVPRIPCQITFRGMVASEPPRAEVRAWLEKLGPLTSSMTAGQVLIEAVDRGRKEQHYRVRMDLTLPTSVVVVDYDHPSNGPHEDVYVAIRNAFRAARRQLEAHARMLTEATGDSATLAAS